MMRALRVFLAIVIFLIILLMAILSLPLSRHESLAYSRAFVAHYDTPNEATRQALQNVRAEENSVFFKTELVSSVPLVLAAVAIILITRRLRSQSI